MFFPDLLNLKKRQINNHDIDLLDWWLGTRKNNNRKYLNPLQFSIDCRIDVNHAMKLFSLCVLEPSIQLLSVRYILKCPNCSDVLDRQEVMLDPTSIIGKHCGNCGIRLTKEELTDSVEIYFTLLKVPLNVISGGNIPIGIGTGKIESLQGSTAKQVIGDDADLCRLFSFLVD